MTDYFVGSVQFQYNTKGLRAFAKYLIVHNHQYDHIYHQATKMHLFRWENVIVDCKCTCMIYHCVYICIHISILGVNINLLGEDTFARILAERCNEFPNKLLALV